MRHIRWGWMAFVVGCGGSAEPSFDDEPARLSAAAWPQSAPSSSATAVNLAQATAFCEGRATRRLRIQGNLDPAMPVTWAPDDPADASPMWVTPTVYASGGLRLSPNVYFNHYVGFFTYHVRMPGSRVDLGSGALYFDVDGALQHVKELTPFRMPGPAGFEAPLEHVFGTPTSEGGTGLDGMTSRDPWSGISALMVDGAPRETGYACPDVGEETEVLAPPDSGVGATLPPELVPCPAQPTRRVAIRANLAADAPIVTGAFDRRVASMARFVTTFLAHGPSGMQAAFDLYFRKVAARQWEYRVLLQTDGVAPELARGLLTFDAAGVLAAVDVLEPLRFPTSDGTAGPLITLDLGTPTAENGSGVDGVTALPIASVLRSIEYDGLAAAVGVCTEGAPIATRLGAFPAPFSDEHFVASHRPTPACAGDATRVVSLGFLLDTRLPIDEAPWSPDAPKGPSDVWTSVLLRGTALEPVRLELRARRVGPSSWELHALTTDGGALTPRTSLRLDETSGILSHVEGVRSFALPLPDGRDGPPIELDVGTPLDEAGPRHGVLLAAESTSALLPWANGSPASDCALDASTGR